MYCLHCKYTTKLRNDKEINAFFASAYQGVQLSQLHQQSKILPQISQHLPPTEQNSPTDFTASATNRAKFSHRLHRYSQIRRVWHPCHTHAATKLSSHGIHGTQKRQVGNILPQIAQKFLTQDILPQIADFHRLGGYGIPCHTHAATKLSSHRIH